MDRLKRSGFYHMLSLIYMLIHTINSERKRESNEYLLIAVGSLVSLCF